MTPLLIAHQSGWDELLLFVGPIVAVLLWVRWAERRAERRRAEAEDASSNMPSDTDA
jgi:cytochrome c-type biogenesis protein CcmH/NrfF